MFCTKCGKEIDDNAKFCGFCGNKAFSLEDDTPDSSDHGINYTDDNADSVSEENTSNKKGIKKILMIISGIIVLGVVIGTFVLFVTPLFEGSDNSINPNNNNSNSLSSDISDESYTNNSFKEPEENQDNYIPDESPKVISEEWIVFNTSEEINEIVHLFPFNDNMNPVFKYTWSSHNVLTLAFDATYIFQSLFDGLDVPEYIEQNNIELLDNIELHDAAGKCVAMGYFIPASFAEETLEGNALTLFGINSETLRNSSYYGKEKNAYLYQTGLGGADVSDYEIEKIIIYDDYAFVYQRLWSDYNPENKKSEAYGPKSYGCVTVLKQHSDSENYHFVSNFAVKDIDTVIENTFYNSFYSIEPEEYELTEKYISFVTSGSGLRIRTGPGEDYDSIITIPLDAPVLCLAERDGWIYVRYNTVYGWMSSEYLIRK